MQKMIKLIWILPILIVQGLTAQTIGTFTDSRDGKIYSTVKIGEQVWMAQNLNFKIDNSDCYEHKTENCDAYGHLYSWELAMKACPVGWHLPSDQEWMALEKFLGMSDADLIKNKMWRGTNQSKRLVSDTTIGFRLLYGGYKNPPSNFNLLKSQAFFWTSTQEQGSAWFRQMYEGSTQIFRQTRPLNWSFSVRCVKD
jgi:uncharacterized protein (TIGR02145 family)